MHKLIPISIKREEFLSGWLNVIILGLRHEIELNSPLFCDFTDIVIEYYKVEKVTDT